MARTRTREENLSNLMTTTEFNERDRGILALQYSRFDVEIAREVEMLLDKVSRAWG